MFVMANDGGPLDEDASDATAERTLCQRIFFFNLLSRGISVTLFKGAEYRDSKVHRHSMSHTSIDTLTHLMVYTDIIICI
jgi:hypothetical protein